MKFLCAIEEELRAEEEEEKEKSMKIEVILILNYRHLNTC